MFTCITPWRWEAQFKWLLNVFHTIKSVSSHEILCYTQSRLSIQIDIKSRLMWLPTKSSGNHSLVRITESSSNAILIVTYRITLISVPDVIAMTGLQSLQHRDNWMCKGWLFRPSFVPRNTGSGNLGWERISSHWKIKSAKVLVDCNFLFQDGTVGICSSFTHSLKERGGERGCCIV